MIDSKLQQHGKLEMYDLCFLQKVKTVINLALSIKETVLVVHVALLKSNVIQK